MAEAKDYRSLYKSALDHLKGQKKINVWQEGEIRRLKAQIEKYELEMRLMKERFKEYEPLLRKDYNETDVKISKLLGTRVYDYDLSIRALNLFKSLDINYIGDLVSRPKKDLKGRNSGPKTLEEITKFVHSLGLDFEMEIVFNPISESYMIAKDITSD